MSRTNRPASTFILIVLLLVSALAGCSSSRAGSGAITQFSTINSLMVGRYDGVASLRQLLTYGDFGLGTFDQLDGEMIVLDGKIYQATSDGAVRQPSLGLTTPLAVVVPFHADRRGPCPPLASLVEIEKRVDAFAGGRNTFAAIRVDGRFTFVSMRSVPRQVKPFVPLTEAAKRQSLWVRRDVSGTLVGIRCPRWAGGVNVPGYHWHFISDDRSMGGHVIDCAIQSGSIACGIYRDWQVKLGSAPDIDDADFDKIHSEDLEQVERMRNPPTSK